MKLNKIILVSVVMFMLLFSSVSAFQVLSSDVIDFTNSADVAYGETFVVLAVENGQTETLQFSSFENKLSADGYDLTGTGSIEGTVISSELYYKATLASTDNIVPSIDFVETSFNPFLDKNEWCAELAAGKSWAIVTKESVYYGCAVANVLGYYAILDNADAKMVSEIKVVANGKSQTIQFTDTSRENYINYSDDRDIAAEITSFDVESTGDVNINDRFAMFFKNNGAEIIINAYDHTVLTDTYYLQKWSDCVITDIGEDFQSCEDKINVLINSKIAPADENYAGGVMTVKDSGVSFVDGKIYKYPNYRLLIDAEWVGIFRPNGEPEIISFTISDLIEGTDNLQAEGKASITVKNVGTGVGNFDFAFECNNIIVDAIPATSFAAGETKTIRVDVSANARVGCEDVSCTLIVTDKTSQIKDSTNTGSTVCEVNQCDFVNEQQCIGSVTQVCGELNGVLVWSDGVDCGAGGCQLNNGIAECQDEKSLFCNANNICDAVESFQTCKNDCSVAGDGYCSPIEREKGLDPVSCDQEPPKDDNTLLIVGIVGGFLMLVAIGVKIKQSGGGSQYQQY